MRLLSIVRFFALVIPIVTAGVSTNNPSSNSDGHRPNEYTVKLRQKHSLDDHFAFIKQNLTQTHEFFHWIPAIRWYHIKIENDAVLPLIQNDPGVEMVNKNPIGRIGPVAAEAPSNSPRQKRWDLLYRGQFPWFSMITSPYKLGDPVKDPSFLPYFLEGGGEGVHAYVVDTGILLNHQEFISNGINRAVNFHDKFTSPYTSPSDLVSQPIIGPNDDIRAVCHGTGVASILGGNTFGTALGVTLVNVRVADNNGTFDVANLLVSFTHPPTFELHFLIQLFSARAINDIVSEHNSYKSSGDGTWRGSVINLSLGVLSTNNGYSPNVFQMLYDSLKLTRDNNIPVIVAAGNNNLDLESTPVWPCSFVRDSVYGPHLGNLWCIGATDNYYRKSGVSNYGSHLDQWAPGEGIEGATCSDTSAEYSWTGTSFAAPLTAGAMASFVSFEALVDNYRVANRRMSRNSLTNAVYYGDSTTQFLNVGVDNTGDGPFLDAPYDPVIRNGVRPPCTCNIGDEDPNCKCENCKTFSRC